jgi:hypothetical protein
MTGGGCPNAGRQRRRTVAVWRGVAGFGKVADAEWRPHLGGSRDGLRGGIDEPGPAVAVGAERVGDAAYEVAIVKPGRVAIRGVRGNTTSWPGSGSTGRTSHQPRSASTWRASVRSPSSSFRRITDTLGRPRTRSGRRTRLPTVPHPVSPCVCFGAEGASVDSHEVAWTQNREV